MGDQLDNTSPDLFVPLLVEEMTQILDSQIPSAQPRNHVRPWRSCPPPHPDNYDAWKKTYEVEEAVRFPVKESRHYESFYAEKASGR
jgi:hypothetical protein